MSNTLFAMGWADCSREHCKQISIRCPAAIRHFRESRLLLRAQVRAAPASPHSAEPGKSAIAHRLTTARSRLERSPCRSDGPRGACDQPLRSRRRALPVSHPLFFFSTKTASCMIGKNPPIKRHSGMARSEEIEIILIWITTSAAILTSRPAHPSRHTPLKLLEIATGRQTARSAASSPEQVVLRVINKIRRSRLGKTATCTVTQSCNDLGVRQVYGCVK